MQHGNDGKGALMLRQQRRAGQGMRRGGGRALWVPVFETSYYR
jgi:hypothetical protein